MMVPSPASKFIPVGLGDASSSWCIGLAANGLAYLDSSCTAALSVPAPATVPPPTQAQLDAVSASPNPGVAANQLVQTLANEAVTQSQANIATVNDVAPYVLPTPPTPAAPLCGTGSTQWVSGIDNCVLLGIGGAGFLLLILMSSRGRR